jgi:6-pyruvoyltetrahydropterin/6-carboxytetrahydropterin synthase
MFEITIENTFSASHALALPDGQSEPLHGHNWPVTVTVARPDLDNIETVMDFHHLEQILSSIIAPMNNRHLNDLEPFAAGKINPTAERVAWWIATQVQKQLPPGVSLVRVTVGEAPRCTAIYRP